MRHCDTAQMDTQNILSMPALCLWVRIIHGAQTVVERGSRCRQAMANH